MKPVYALPVFLAALVLAVAAAAAPATVVVGSEPARAGLVISFGNGTVATRCIELTGAGMTGYDVLVASGLDVIVGGSPQAPTTVCRIGDTGCPAESCFCAYPPNFWSYWHLSDGRWQFAITGVGSYVVPAGGVEGWSWGNGAPPPVMTFDAVCAAATPSVTATPPVSSTGSIMIFPLLLQTVP